VLQRDPILISLSPTSLRIGVIAGNQVARVERVAVDARSDDAWKGGLRSLDEALRNTLIALSVRPGTPAFIIYHGPRSVAEVFSVPGSGSAAASAVELYLHQNLPNASSSWLTDYHLLADGTSEPADQAHPGASSGARSTVLTYADSADDADVLAGWVRRAGLEVEGVLPAKAAMLLAGLRIPEVCKLDQPDAPPRVYIHLGEHAMTLTAWQGKRLLLARCAEVGYSLLVDAILRSAHLLPKSEHFTREHATRVLFAGGLPQRGHVVDHGLNLTGEAVLPLMQPAMQRYVVETRQTMRFGMLESDASRASVQLIGPGAGIPGLADALGVALELQVQVSEDAAKPGEAIGEEHVGDLSLALELRAHSGWFLPGSVRVQRTTRRMARSVRAGAAVAILTLGAFAGKAYLGERTLRPAIAELQAQADAIDAEAKAAAAVQQKARDLESIMSITNQAIGVRTNWRAALGVLSRSMPKGVELLDISADFRSADTVGQPALSIRGRIEPGPQDQVSKLLAAISASPIVASARVVSSRVDAEGEREFAIVIELKGVATPGHLINDASDGALPEAGSPASPAVDSSNNEGTP
jgi:Tfp pilus assembly protein PilN/Tfp pilus assembly PilM family ATPase